MIVYDDAGGREWLYVEKADRLLRFNDKGKDGEMGNGKQDTL